MLNGSYSRLVSGETCSISYSASQDTLLVKHPGASWTAGMLH
jgi:hypothetical protein